MKVLLCVTGSVAATVIDQVVKELSGHQVKIAVTESGWNFVKDVSLPFKVATSVLRDKDEWDVWHVERKVLHIDLKDWADVIVFAPLSANTLAKMANGMCDNLVTSIFRAWPKDKPIILAPAMNTDMWENPVTRENLQSIWNRYSGEVYMVQPVEKMLVCGAYGTGAMADASSIADMVGKVREYKENEK